MKMWYHNTSTEAELLATQQFKNALNNNDACRLEYSNETTALFKRSDLNGNGLLTREGYKIYITEFNAICVSKGMKDRQYTD